MRNQSFGHKLTPNDGIQPTIMGMNILGIYISTYISRWFGRHIFGILWDHDQTCRTAAFYRGIGVVNDVSKWIGRWLVNVCPGKQSLLYCFNKDTLSAFRIRDLFWCLISFIIRVCMELINYELPNSYQNHMPNSDQSHTVTLSTEKWYDTIKPSIHAIYPVWIVSRWKESNRSGKAP